MLKRICKVIRLYISSLFLAPFCSIRVFICGIYSYFDFKHKCNYMVLTLLFIWHNPTYFIYINGNTLGYINFFFLLNISLDYRILYIWSRYCIFPFLISDIDTYMADMIIFISKLLHISHDTLVWLSTYAFVRCVIFGRNRSDLLCKLRKSTFFQKMLDFSVLIVYTYYCCTGYLWRDSSVG